VRRQWAEVIDNLSIPWCRRASKRRGDPAGVKVAAIRTGILAVLLAAALTAALVAAPSRVSAQEQTRVVEGSIFNATQGGGGVGGLPVTLHQISALGPLDLRTDSDDQGRFRFDGISFDPARAYGVSVRFQGAIYGTDLDLSAGSPDPVSITVYDASSDDTIVSVTSASLLLASVDRASQTVAALEIINLANESDHAYVPGPDPMRLLRFGLPPGATGLQVDTRLIDADYAQVDRGFALFASVPPGEHQLTFSYRFPYEGDELTLEKSYRYGAGTVRVLAPYEVMAIKIAQLGDPESITIGQRQFQLIEAGGVARGETLSIQLGGLPRASARDRIGRSLDNIRFEYAAPVALGVLMAVLLAYGVLRKGRDTRQPPHQAPDEVPPDR